MRSLRIGALFAGAAVVGIAAVIAVRAPALFSGSTETFDGTPPAPLNFSSSEWDVQVHSRDSSSWTDLPAINAQHGSDCAAPPASHPNTSYEGSVFQCANHLMTAINGSAGYAAIYLTPNRLLEFSSSGVVEFELSTERMSTRDWWDITISPFSEAQALPLLSSLSQGVDLQEPNRNSVVVATDNGEGAPQLKTSTNGTIFQYGNPGIAQNAGVTAPNQAATRQPFRLTISPTNVKFERLASATGNAVVFFDQPVSLSWSSGVVQIGHHSYTPEKEGAGVPATWHWDTVSINPSTPFTIIKADQRALFSAGTVTFPAAPANSVLRFSAICKPIVNGTPLTKMTDSGHAEHAASYQVPVAAGATSATLAFTTDDGWYSGPCHAKDFHVWALSSSSSSPTATATLTATPTAPAPTATSTSIPTSTPTSIVTPTPTSTSSPTSTPTTAPTATPTITPSPTPTAAACLRVRGAIRNANGTYPAEGWLYISDPALCAKFRTAP